MKPFTLLENSSIALAIIVFGIMAGFFWTYTFNVNMAMLQVDGKTYAQVQSLFNVNVRHAMFFIFFFGGGAISFVAVVINSKHIKHVSFWLLVIASITYILGVIIFTAQVNLPLNDYVESWDLNAVPSDWQMVRDSWNEANGLRVVTSFIAFCLAVVALCTRCHQASGERSPRKNTPL